MNFSYEFFIPKGTALQKALQINIEHFEIGYHMDIITVAGDVDIASEDA